MASIAGTPCLQGGLHVFFDAVSELLAHWLIASGHIYD